jgi:hypothetical protein
MFRKIILTSFLAGLFVATTEAYPPITQNNITIVGHRWVRPSTGPNTAAYLTITNPSKKEDKLLKVTCDYVTSVELHNNIEENGIMKMRPVEFIEIGADPVELKPGGLHIMLMGLKPSFHGKEKIPLTLYFEKAGSVTIDFSVKAPETTHN